jgi:hypothetical protein
MPVSNFYNGFASSTGAWTVPGAFIISFSPSTDGSGFKGVISGKCMLRSAISVGSVTVVLATAVTGTTARPASSIAYVHVPRVTGSCG